MKKLRISLLAAAAAMAAMVAAVQLSRLNWLYFWTGPVCASLAALLLFAWIVLKTCMVKGKADVKKLRVALLIAAAVFLAFSAAASLARLRLDDLTNPAGFLLAALMLILWGILGIRRTGRKLLKAALLCFCVLLAAVALFQLCFNPPVLIPSVRRVLVSPSGQHRAAVVVKSGGRTFWRVYPVRAHVLVDTRQVCYWTDYYHEPVYAWLDDNTLEIRLELASRYANSDIEPRTEYIRF